MTIDAATLKYIKDRLPSDHGFIDADIDTEFIDNNQDRNLTLAALWERLASADRYANTSIGALSYSNPVMLERAAYWRGRVDNPLVPGDETGSISFIPVAQPFPFSAATITFGTELG